MSLPGLLEAAELEHVVVAVGVWVLLTAGSVAVVLRVVLTLPHDYFEAAPPERARWTLARVARNLAGLVLIVVGAALSIPAVPGQGLVTLLVGVLLVDVPGRRRLERALVSREGLLAALNGLRARFGRPPLRPPRD